MIRLRSWELQRMQQRGAGRRSVYGIFLNAVVDFLIVAVVIFCRKVHAVPLKYPGRGIYGPDVFR